MFLHNGVKICGFKRDRAEQTVRPRDLKLGQMGGLNLGGGYQSVMQIGPQVALQQPKMLNRS